MEKGRALKVVYNLEPYGYSEEAIRLWSQNGYTYKPGSWDEIEEKDQFKEVKVLIVRLQRKISYEILQKFPNLEKIVSATTGSDHLELEELKRRGINCFTLKGHDKFLETIPSTAEHTWGLLLSLVRNIPAANEQVKNGQWNRDRFRGNQLREKTLGVIGYGRTGRMVSKYAKAFGMNVQYFDPYVYDNNIQKVYILEELLASADILSIHVHLTNETQELLNTDNIGKVKRGAFLLNTSRGKVWDESAVAKALLEKEIKGVAVDVISTELENFKRSPLWLAQEKGLNVIITPHVGGATWEAMWACEEYITLQANMEL